ncbi:MAG: SDR family oxidoreductase, partial [Alphaproteobacteria bacterium]
RNAFGTQSKRIHPIGDQDPRQLVGTIAQQWGAVDVLVNNDFAPAVRAPVEDASLDDLNQALQAIVVAPFAMTAAVVPSMKARKRGKVLFLSSAAPLRGLPNYSIYCAARGGTNALAVSLAQELAPYNIQVNALAFNFVESESYFPKKLLADPEARAKITKNVPLGRLARPEEAAALVAFLAGPDSDFITGQVIPFAGGWA